MKKEKMGSALKKNAMAMWIKNIMVTSKINSKDSFMINF